MNPSPGLCRFRRPLCVAGSLLAGALCVAARADNGDIATIYSEASPDYTRVRLSNGSFQPETYTIGEGGRMAGMTRDATADALTILDAWPRLSLRRSQRGTTFRSRIGTPRRRIN